MSDFILLKSLSTGKTGLYPAHFVALDDLVEINSEDVGCIDCAAKVDTGPSIVEPLVVEKPKTRNTNV